MEYVDIARKFEARMLKVCIKAPKRLTFLLCQELMRLSSQLHNEVRSANNIQPTNAHEAQMRRDHLIEANNALHNIVPKLGLLYEALMEDPNGSKWCDSAVQELSAMLLKEKELIQGVKQADKSRYKNLK